jgi:hypothetical protein
LFFSPTIFDRLGLAFFSLFVSFSFIFNYLCTLLFNRYHSLLSYIMPESTLEPWKWALIGVGTLLSIISVAGAMYCLINKNKKCKNDINNEKPPVNSDEEEAIDEGIMTTTTATVEASIKSTTDNSSMQQKEANLYGQQFALVTPASTVLSPPRSQQHPHQQQKPTTSTAPIIHQIQEEEGEEEEDPSKLRIFSLSPLHRPPQSSDSPSSSFRNNTHNADSICSNSSNTTHRAMTPFQGNTPTINDVWRGPTPPWTQYPGR